MSSESTTETKFAFESFLPLWTIILLGVLLLGLSWWMGRRDFRAAERSKLVWVLVLLRSIATLVVLWMLAGPTLVTITRIFQKKSIALLIDTSASMGLADLPDGTGNVTRWAAAVRDSGATRRVQQFDSALGILVASSRELERFAALPEATAENAAARDLFSRAVTSIGKGLDLLTAATQGLPADDLSAALVDATQGLRKGAAGRLQSKAADFSRGKSLRSLQREQWLPAERDELEASIAALQRAADQFTTSVEEPSVRANAATPNGSKISRLERVEAFVRDAENSWLKELSANAIIHRYQFGDKVVRAESSAEKKPGSSASKQPLAPATHLGAALQQIALDSSARPLEAAILITDGGQNAGRDPREIAPSLRETRLHIVPIGRTKMERDVILHHAQAPKAVLQNDTVVIESVISAYDCEKEALQVELLDAETVVERQTVNVTSAVFDTNVQMRWKAAKTGKHSLTMRVAPLGKERSEENNSAKSDITVMEEKMRVLVADNFPRWETRYLLNLFKRDERLSFDQLLFEPQPVTGESVRSNFPGSLEEWSKYRVIILGDVLPSQLRADSQRLLHQYVSEMGGNLILVAGKDAMPAAFVNGPLGPLLPVQQAGRGSPGAGPRYLHVPEEASQNLAIQIGDTPAVSQRIWREMSERLPVYSFSAFSQPKATTHTLIWAGKNKENVDLADPSTCSFLAWHYVGAGRVIYISAPLTYQLRYRTGDKFHHRFWGQLLRWAVGRELAEGSQTVRLSTDKLRYEVGDPLQVSAQLRQLDGKPVTDAAVEVEAWQHGKVLQKVALKEDARRAGSYHALLPDLPAGVVKLQATGDRIGELLASEQYRRPVEVTINIDPSAMVELRHALCNMPLLREIADASRGMVLPPTALEAVMKELNLEPERSENITKKALWNRWDLFCLFIACLSLEWAGRKYLGLS